MLISVECVDNLSFLFFFCCLFLFELMNLDIVFVSGLVEERVYVDIGECG